MAEDVYHYCVYDITIDDYRYSTRYATLPRINKLGGEPIYPGTRIDAKHLTDGWTKKGFDPQNPDQWPVLDLMVAYFGQYPKLGAWPVLKMAVACFEISDTPSVFLGRVP
jgi:hypothetical protein